MYSMKRRMWPLWRKWRASGRIWSSLVPRLTAQFTLTGARPAAAAAAMPSSTSPTGKSTSFMRLNTASSMPSRLTVTRCSPASLSARAFVASSEPLVVRVISTGSRASCSIRFSRCRRSSGSPPVMRIFSTPWSTKIFATRTISSKDSSCLRGRKA